MRTTALILGIISGVWGMIIGFFGWGYTEFINWFGDIPDIAEQVDNINKVRFTSLGAPILALVGGGLAVAQPYVAAILLFMSSFGMYWGFEFGVFTMFPISMCFIAGMLAMIAAITRKD